ncbi:uncharacterized protein LOC143888842 [Tasmannia lanceolata]|uniref:uncharacterized protein LOC143888842 n=1 Tax=Tasmannia lanceolata TaxID=3420 RepID=UPI0040636AF5
MAQVIQTPQQQQYLCKLLGYNYTIVYKAGKDNQAADALSRIDASTLVPSSFHLAVSNPIFNISSDIQWENTTNPELIALHEQLRQGIAAPEFTTLNGLLFHKNRLFPSSDSPLRNIVLHECHSTPQAGHPGILRTIKKLSGSFYWLKMWMMFINLFATA